MDENFSPEPTSWVDRLKESPRTVSAIIIILIVAAAIYAFSGNNEQQPAETTPSPIEEAAESATPTPSAAAAAISQAPSAEPVSKEELVKKAESLPKATKTDKGYVEVAERGNGRTHLARRAATRWLSENQAGYQVTNEHRIYIEDYIRKQMAKGQVKIGQSETVSFDLIADAVAKAGQLNAKQLNNLTKYTRALK